ncbi:flavin reductase family protein [Phaeobacter sp. C3_T13_0]|uniref:flavin reductase family protein n=1 Tax=Phaeobacter cretensis TaxID=3342641 RepID=UPI0039BD2CA2
MFYDPRHYDRGLPHNPWLGLIIRRPIGWVSTAAPDGTANLAPYSCFNAIASNPPFLMLSSDGTKDSVRNAEATGFFCVNIATYELREAMIQSAAACPPGVDEFVASGLDAVACRNIPVQRVAQSPVAIECKLSQIVTLASSADTTCTNRVAIGEVVGIYIEERVLREGLVDVDLLKPLGRMEYREYTVPQASFEMSRPTIEPYWAETDESKKKENTT